MLGSDRAHTAGRAACAVAPRVAPRVALAVALAALLGRADPAWACYGDGDGVLCVPGDLADTTLQKDWGLNTSSDLASIVSAALLRAYSTFELAPSWTDPTGRCVTLLSAGDVTLRSASPGVRVSLPGLTVYDGTLTLTDATLADACLGDPDGDGSSLAYAVIAKYATFTATNVRLEGSEEGGGGLSLIGAKDSLLTLTDSELVGAPYPAVVLTGRDRDAVLTADGVQFTDNPGGALLVERAAGHNSSNLELSLSGCTFSGNVGHSYSASDVSVTEAHTVTVTDTDFTGHASTPPSTCAGGDEPYPAECSRALQIADTAVVNLERVRFTDYAWQDAAAVELFNQTLTGSATLTGLTFNNITGTGEGTFGGGAMLLYRWDAELSGVVATDIRAEQGALVRALGYGDGALTLRTVDVQGFEGTAVSAEYIPSLDLSQSWFCDGVGGADEGLFVHAVETQLTVQNTVFRDSLPGRATSSIYFDGHSSFDATIVNNTFAAGGPTALRVRSSGTSSVKGDNTFDLYNNLVVDATQGVLVEGVTRLAPYVQHNLYWQVDGSLWTVAGVDYGAGDLGAYNSLEADPLFWADYTPGDCTVAPYLDWGSPAIDAGFTDLEDPKHRDPDGSATDIGAYGGAGAVLGDLDGDGEPVGQDCDDNDALVNHSQPETGYDGLDNDCDSSTPDDDLDGDGVGVDEDCDDNDPLLGAPTEERLGDGIDQDCDGHDATASFTNGCAVTGGAPAAPNPAALALLALAALRRRR